MSGWAAKRFWSEVAVVPEDGGFGIRLDRRVLKTPGQSALVLPTAALAEAVAEEWRAQGELIQPLTMPFTRMSNSAVEKVAPLIEEVAAAVAAYGGSDLICYRAERPMELVRRQVQWDKLVDWAEAEFGARLVTTAGVMPVAQDPAALDRLGAAVRALGPFRLSALHDLVALSGSLVIGFAVARGHVVTERGWALSRIDEDWQAEEWGPDAEAAVAAERRESDFRFAKKYFDLAGPA